MVETVRYTYRLRPGRRARAALLDEWSRCRWLWNEAVHQQRSGRKPTFGKLKKDSLPSLEYTRNGFKLKNHRLVLSKGIIVPVVWSRELLSAPSSVRVYQDSLGHWYASFVVRCEAAAIPEPDLPGIGIDWGGEDHRDDYRARLRPAAPGPPSPVCRRTGQGPAQDGTAPPAQRPAAI
ncbi:hypothetical protein [Actinoplanes sichuanensis]|uniref:hypothetical protein n=1 Tax=Actinoplanes sichuanensis TaxID=512349 RepID=UPI00366BDE7A